MKRQPSCLTCARLLHSILFQRPIGCDYVMDYPRPSRSSTRGSQAWGTRLPTLYPDPTKWDHITGFVQGSAEQNQGLFKDLSRTELNIFKDFS